MIEAVLFAKVGNPLLTGVARGAVALAWPVCVGRAAAVWLPDGIGVGPV